MASGMWRPQRRVDDCFVAERYYGFTRDFLQCTRRVRGSKLIIVDSIFETIVEFVEPALSDRRNKLL